MKTQIDLKRLGLFIAMLIAVFCMGMVIWNAHLTLQLEDQIAIIFGTIITWEILKFNFPNVKKEEGTEKPKNK